MKSEFIFQQPAYYVLGCLVLGVLYAWMLYSKKSTLSKTNNLFLSALRGLLVSTLAFILLNVFLKSNTTSIEKPVAVLAVDNSVSMKNLGLLAKIKEAHDQLKSTGREVFVEFLGKGEEEFDGLNFNQKTSDLSGLLGQIKSNYEGQNLTDVVLLSDGIVNAGVSPTYSKYNFKVHTVGVGDTTRKVDVRLGAVYTNKLAYLGNKFPVQADVSAFGFAGKQATVLLKDGSQVLDQQIVSFDSQISSKSVTLYGIAKEKGLKRLTVEVIPLANESSKINNKREVIVEVVNGKEKVLIVALAPHPDIKAIKSILEKNELYEVQTQILSVESSPKVQEFDILIVHQLPDIQVLGMGFLANIMAKNKPTFFFVGNQTNIPMLNGYQQVVGIAQAGNQTDNVLGKFNESFKKFEIDLNRIKLLEKLPPIKVPYGDFRMDKQAEILLYQKVASVSTTKPILAVNLQSVRKTAIFTGEGLWQWRMEEYALTDKQEVVDDLIQKTIQLISVKDDKRKLRVEPTQPEFQLGDKVSFSVETYNDIFERIYNQSIKISIKDSKGKIMNFDFQNSDANARFEISDLAAGSYSFDATATVLGKQENMSGQFFISDVDLEMQDLTADWNLLRTVSKKNDGNFVAMKDFGQLIQKIKSVEIPSRVSNREEVKEIISLKWLFFFLLLLATVEWVIRKYSGTY